MKKCTKCSIEKPISDFYKKSNVKEGIENRCKTCANKHKQAHYQNNKDRYKELNAEWRNANKGKSKEILIRWRENNPNKYREKEKIWRSNNREKRSEYNREWKSNNRDKCNLVEAKRRTNLKCQLPMWSEEHEITLLYKKASNLNYQVDHIVPINNKYVSGLPKAFQSPGL